MNSQQENNCIAYFKSNPVWNRVFRGFWEKYRSYGSFSGKVVLQKITAEEVEGLEGFFAKSYHGEKECDGISGAFFLGIVKQQVC